MRTCAVFFGDPSKNEQDLVILYGDKYFTSRNEFLAFLIDELRFTPQMAKTVMHQAFQRNRVERSDMEVMLKTACNLKVTTIRSILSLRKETKRTKKVEEPVQEVVEAPVAEVVETKPKRTRKKKTEETAEKPVETPKKKRSTRKKKTDE